MGLFRERFKVKACSRCGGVKPTDEFYGNDHYCIDCRKDYTYEWNKAHPDRRYLIRWRSDNKNQDKRNGGRKEQKLQSHA